MTHLVATHDSGTVQGKMGGRDILQGGQADLSGPGLPRLQRESREVADLARTDSPPPAPISEVHQSLEAEFLSSGGRRQMRDLGASDGRLSARAHGRKTWDSK